MKFVLLINLKLQLQNSFLLSMKISLINMKMPTIVGIFIFIIGENFMLSRVEYEKYYITSGSGHCVVRIKRVDCISDC